MFVAKAGDEMLRYCLSGVDVVERMETWDRTAKGKKIEINPAFFAVVDGQLYLNSSQAAHENVFLQDVPGTISKGEGNWKRIFATEAGNL